MRPTEGAAVGESDRRSGVSQLPTTTSRCATDRALITRDGDRRIGGEVYRVSVKLTVVK